MPDIIYILPANSGPVGGVKVQLQHVRMLRQAGFSAEAYALANFHDWYDAGFPVTTARGLRLPPMMEFGRRPAIYSKLRRSRRLPLT